jgi:hypothetical protein
MKNSCFVGWFRMVLLALLLLFATPAAWSHGMGGSGGFHSSGSHNFGFHHEGDHFFHHRDGDHFFHRTTASSLGSGTRSMGTLTTTTRTTTGTMATLGRRTAMSTGVI